VKDFSRTLLWNIADGHPHAELEKEFQKLERAARKEFRAEHWAGKLLFERSLDLRYRGQGYELNITAAGTAVARFHQEHQRRYGYHHPGKAIELVTVRLRGRVKARRSEFAEAARTATRSSKRAKPVEQSTVVFHGRGIKTTVYERSDLAGQILKGPAVITEYSATTVIPPGKKFRVDRAGNLLIAIK
jgi:N-methylhydantoinase A